MSDSLCYFLLFFFGFWLCYGIYLFLAPCKVSTHLYLIYYYSFDKSFCSSVQFGGSSSQSAVNQFRKSFPQCEVVCVYRLVNDWS